VRVRSIFLSLAVAVAGSAFAPNARADVELGVLAGVSAYKSTWRGDYTGGGTLRAGVRFAHAIAVDFQAWESYATVNQRDNTGLSLGVTGYIPLPMVHPYGRLFVMHQHEEGLVSVENAPFGTLFGIGAGIRHRAGGGLSLGVEIPLSESKDKRFTWIGIADVTAMYFPDDTLGPHAYVGINFGIGFDYLLK
jgi:hypothetical protein